MGSVEMPQYRRLLLTIVAIARVCWGSASAHCSRSKDCEESTNSCGTYTPYCDQQHGVCMPYVHRCPAGDIDCLPVKIRSDQAKCVSYYCDSIGFCVPPSDPISHSFISSPVACDGYLLTRSGTVAADGCYQPAGLWSYNNTATAVTMHRSRGQW